MTRRTTPILISHDGSPAAARTSTEDPGPSREADGSHVSGDVPTPQSPRREDMPEARGSTGRGPIGPMGSFGFGFLERFRRTAGVPSRVADDAAVELAPVFAVLDAFEHEAQEVRDRSSRMAAQRLHRAQEDAAALAGDAHDRADFERGDALKAGLRSADVETAAILAAGEAEAGAIRHRGEERLSQLVAEIVARVREAPS